MSNGTGVDLPIVIVTVLLGVIVYALTSFGSQHLYAVPARLIGRWRPVMWLYALVLCPGTLLHEAGHAAACILLQVEIEEFSIRPSQHGDSIRLGYVSHRGDVGLLRRSAIGVAPLILGLVALSLIGIALFDLIAAYTLLAAGDWLRAIETVLANFGTWHGWVGVYLVFVVSVGMFPSAIDVRPWPFVAGVGLLLIGAVVAVALGPGSPNWLCGPLNSVFRWMLLILGITVLIDVPCVLLLSAAHEAVVK